MVGMLPCHVRPGQLCSAVAIRTGPSVHTVARALEIVPVAALQAAGHTLHRRSERLHVLIIQPKWSPPSLKAVERQAAGDESEQHAHGDRAATSEAVPDRRHSEQQW
jgi:hypothetical protein